MDEAARRLGHRPARAPAAEPRAARRGLHPRRHAGRRRLGADRRARGRADRLGRRRRPPGRGRGIAVGLKSGPTTGLSYSTVRLLADGSVDRLRRHLGHGPGRAHDLRPDRRRGARRAARLGHGRHGRHGGRAVRPADLGQPVVRADGQRGPRGLPRHPGEAPGDGRAARVGRRGGRSSSTAARSGSATGSCRSATSSSAGLGPARRRAHRHRRDAQGGRARTIRSAGRAAFFEFNCTAVEVEVDRETGDVVVARHVTVSDVGKALNPTPGPRPGRGRRGHGSRPHADGALHLRRRRAGSGTSAPSTTGSRRAWTCRSDGERHHRERGRARARTARRA